MGAVLALPTIRALRRQGSQVRILSGAPVFPFLINLLTAIHRRAANRRIRDKCGVSAKLDVERRYRRRLPATPINAIKKRTDDCGHNHAALGCQRNPDCAEADHGLDANGLPYLPPGDEQGPRTWHGVAPATRSRPF